MVEREEEKAGWGAPRSPPYGFAMASAIGPTYHVAAMPMTTTGMVHAIEAQQAMPGGSLRKSATSSQFVLAPSGPFLRRNQKTSTKTMTAKKAV